MNKQNPYVKYALDYNEVRKDLESNGFDFNLADEIQSEIGKILDEYGDTPEAALVLAAAGWSGKCMAVVGSDISNSSDNELAAFEIIDAIVSSHESDLWDVLIGDV